MLGCHYQSIVNTHIPSSLFTSYIAFAICTLHVPHFIHSVTRHSFILYITFARTYAYFALCLFLSNQNGFMPLLLVAPRYIRHPHLLSITIPLNSFTMHVPPNTSSQQKPFWISLFPYTSKHSLLLSSRRLGQVVHSIKRSPTSAHLSSQH